MRYSWREPWLAACLVLLLSTAGMTPGWSQANDLKSSGSEATLNEWEHLMSKSRGELTALRQSLTAALSEATASKLSLEKSMSLLDTSSKRITALETFNQQIGERMQLRDEELAEAYQELDEQDKTILSKNNTILKLWIALAIMGVVILGAAALTVAKLYFKVKLPFLGG